MVLRDAHEGECGNHTNGRNLSLKIPRLGYYWPTLRHDALITQGDVTPARDMDLTTPKTATGKMPYSLVYATEDVLPTEIMMPTARYELLMTVVNNIELAHDQDTMDELREMARIHMVSYQQRVANTYSKYAHVRAFRVGELVLRKTFQNTVDVTAGKFTDTWERP
ncbi:uncharacterized protein LOC141665390 [Apium graveolens]|uniref:uncharacterized protein LOC141665390 n=1 Tax=Apium graveolens TaxID=4045 RepID=UPI003D7A2C07